jgi:hypothetical protein
MASPARWIIRIGFTAGFVLLVVLSCALGLGAVWLAAHLLGPKGVLLIPLLMLIVFGWFISDAAVKDTDD